MILGKNLTTTRAKQLGLNSLRAASRLLDHIISTDEDPGLRIESFAIAVINLRGVSTNKTIICFIAMQTYKELIIKKYYAVTLL